MNIEITDLDMILNYLETTSLEPHDDYTSEITYKDQKILYRYIKELQQENKKLNGSMQTYNILLKANVEENKQLKEKLDCDLQWAFKYEKQVDNWNKLKEYLINDINDRNGTKIVEFEEGNRVSETISPIYTLMEDKSKTMREVLRKMQELEQGSDSNEI